MTILEYARRYVQRGWSVVPIPRGEKAPTLREWQKLRLTEVDLPSFFNDGENVGVLLGAPSGGLTDVDLDAPETLAVAREFLPRTELIHGRASKPASHWWYVASPAPKTERFRDTDGTCLIELRSSGGQTVVPPSVHPSGEAITWVGDGEPAQVEAEGLRSATARVAACALLIRHWPEKGSRHDGALALAGYLLRGGLEEETILMIVTAVARIAGEEDHREDVLDTIRTFNDGRAVTGGPTLASLLRGDGEKVITLVRTWLGLRASSHVTSACPIPRIRLGNRRLSEKTVDAVEALKAVNASQPRIFQQGGILVRLRRDDEAPRVEALIPDAMRGELDRVALWMKTHSEFADPPMSTVRDILSLPSYDGFPRLRAVAEAPFFTRGGRLVVTPGYHEDARMVLHLPSTLVLPAVPAAPSNDDVRRATALFYELFTDFPFVDDASRAHAIGLAVLPFIREMIDGPTPSHALDSPMPGTGKGLLADLVSLIATGRPIEVMTEAKDNEELRKRITAVLLSGTPFGLFDNITRRLDSAVLSAALTATTWSDRVLGLSKMVRLPIRITWIVTGNNLSFSREMARRAVLIRLDARSPEPQLRTGFKHDPIHEWVRGHRGELVGGALVMVQNWIGQGRPRFTKSRMGSYESWSEVVGGILTAAGIKGFLESLSSFSARANAESKEWGQFITAWWETHTGIPVDTSALFPLAEATLLEVLGDGSERGQRIRLGKALAKRVGWTFAINPTGDGTFVVRLEEAEVLDPERRKRNGWALKRLEGDPNIGTLGKTLGTPEVFDEFDIPNVGPNVPNVDPPSAARASAPWPAEPCFICRRKRWWRSRAGMIACATCHEPAAPELVAASWDGGSA